MEPADLIAAIHADACASIAVADCANDGGRLDLSSFVASLAPGNMEYSGETFTKLDRLGRKLEIARCLYTSYGLPDFGPLPDKRAAGDEVVVALLAVFLEAFRQSGDLRYLNTVFKTVLVGLIEPAAVEFDSRLLRAAEQLLWADVRDARP